MDGGTYWLVYIYYIFQKCLLFLGKPDPKIEDDPATRQRKPLAFSEYETDFFKVFNIRNNLSNFITIF